VNQAGDRARNIRGVDNSPLQTVVTRPSLGLAEPLILANRTNNAAKGTDDSPVPCLTTATGGGIAIAEAIILSQHNSGSPRSSEEPLPTITTGGAANADHPGCARPMLVEPFILSRQGGGAPRPVDEPTPTQTAKHSPVLIAPYYGSGSGETCQSAEHPLPTVTSKGRFGMVVPITHNDGSNRARDVETDPLATITTANRGELAFIAAQFGEREGQAPRVHSIESPTPSICATGHINLIEATPEYDILFRMLEPHELAAAMGFNSDDVTYEFAGTKTEKIKQIGNAVSVSKMRACVGALMADAAPKRKDVADDLPKQAIA
jgi:DNA (cytosine-5)-methyltransferase 1